MLYIHDWMLMKWEMIFDFAKQREINNDSKLIALFYFNLLISLPTKRNPPKTKQNKQNGETIKAKTKSHTHTHTNTPPPPIKENEKKT